MQGRLLARLQAANDSLGECKTGSTCGHLVEFENQGQELPALAVELESHASWILTWPVFDESLMESKEERNLNASIDPKGQVPILAIEIWAALFVA